MNSLRERVAKATCEACADGTPLNRNNKHSKVLECSEGCTHDYETACTSLWPEVESELQAACAVVLEKAANFAARHASHGNLTDGFKLQAYECQQVGLLPVAVGIRSLIPDSTRIVAEHDNLLREEGYEMAHELMPYGHSVGDRRDPRYVPRHRGGDPDKYDDRRAKCVGCEREQAAESLGAKEMMEAILNLCDEEGNVSRDTIKAWVDPGVSLAEHDAQVRAEYLPATQAQIAVLESALAEAQRISYADVLSSGLKTVHKLEAKISTLRVALRKAKDVLENLNIDDKQLPWIDTALTAARKVLE